MRKNFVFLFWRHRSRYPPQERAGWCDVGVVALCTLYLITTSCAPTHQQHNIRVRTHTGEAGSGPSHLETRVSRVLIRVNASWDGPVSYVTMSLASGDNIRILFQKKIKNATDVMSQSLQCRLDKLITVSDFWLYWFWLINQRGHG